MRPLPRVRDLAAAGAAPDFDAVRDQLRKRGRGFLAPVAALDLVETAVTAEFAEGKAAESAAFAELLSGSQSAAMRHAFFAERAARKIPGIARETGTRSVETVGVIGAGTMGGGIAMNFLNAGIPVRLLETKSEALERGVGVIRATTRRRWTRASSRSGTSRSGWALLAPTLDVRRPRRMPTW